MTRLPDAPELDAARLLLAKMGVAPEDLLGTAAPPRHPPCLWHLLEPHP